MIHKVRIERNSNPAHSRELDLQSTELASIHLNRSPNQRDFPPLVPQGYSFIAPSWDRDEVLKQSPELSLRRGVIRPFDPALFAGRAKTLLHFCLLRAM